MRIRGKEVNPSSLVVEGVVTEDCPDFCDAYFERGEFEDGGELSGDDLDDLSDKYPEVLNEMAYQIFI